MPVYEKGWKEDLGNYRPVSLTSVLGKVLEQISLCIIMQNLQDNQGISPSQHRVMKGRSCLTDQISFYDRMTHLLNGGKAVMLSAWTLVKPLTPSPTAFSWRNWLLMAWMGVLYAG